MIIVCDSCGARFHLADGRVGPRGAKVRCSNCHHSFQVAPPDKGGAPAAAPKRAAGPRTGAKRAGSGAATGGKQVGDPDLDNPEFLFDGSDDATSNSTTIPEDVPFSRRGAPAAGDVTQKHVPSAASQDDDATPAGKRAPTPLMGLDPEVSARQDKLNRELEEAAASLRAEPDPREKQRLFDFARDDDFEATPMPGREPSLAAAAAVPSAPPQAVRDGEPDTLARISSEALEESISRWDAPVSNARPRAAAPAPGRRVEVLRASGTPSAPKPAEPAGAAEPRRARVPDPRRVVAPEPGATPVWMSVLAVGVAIGLIASGARASLRQWSAKPLGSVVVQGAGWSAVGLGAAPTRDEFGDPAIEVGGALEGPAGGTAPSVWVTALDTRGQPVGAPVRARVARERFSALLREPTPSARSFRIELAPPEPAPRPLPAATTAAVPATPPGEPAAPGQATLTAPAPAAPAP